MNEDFDDLKTERTEVRGDELHTIVKPQGADWKRSWAELLTIVIYSIIKKRNINSLEEKHSDTENKQRKYCIDIINRAAWCYRQHIKTSFKMILQNRGEDDIAYLSKIKNFENTYLRGKRFGYIDREDRNDPCLILNPIYFATNPSSWSRGTLLYNKRRGIGRHSLRPRGPERGNPIPLRNFVFEPD